MDKKNIIFFIALLFLYINFSVWANIFNTIALPLTLLAIYSVIFPILPYRRRVKRNPRNIVFFILAFWAPFELAILAIVFGSMTPDQIGVSTSIFSFSVLSMVSVIGEALLYAYIIRLKININRKNILILVLLLFFPSSFYITGLSISAGNPGAGASFYSFMSITLIGELLIYFKIKPRKALIPIGKEDLPKFEPLKLEIDALTNYKKLKELAESLKEQGSSAFNQLQYIKAGVFWKEAIKNLKIAIKQAKKFDEKLIPALEKEISSIKAEIRKDKAIIKEEETKLRKSEAMAAKEDKELKELAEKEKKEKEEQKRLAELEAKKQKLEATLTLVKKLIDEKDFSNAKSKSNKVIDKAKSLKFTETMDSARDLLNLAEARELTSKINTLLELEYRIQEPLTIPMIVKELKYSLDDADLLLNTLVSPVGFKKSERDMLKSEAEKTIATFTKPNLYDLINSLNYTFETAKKIGEFMIEEKIIPEFPNVPKKRVEKAPAILPKPAGELRVARGGDWRIEADQSVFYYKVKVENKTPFLVGNIQILLTGIPRGLEVKSDRYVIHSLRPNSYESPTFKLIAKQSCVGDIIEGLVTYIDPQGNQKTIQIEPFEICYVCNLLVPKLISKEEYDRKIIHMEEKKLIIDSDIDISSLENKIANIIKNCNFALLQEMQGAKTEDFRKIEAFAQGLYDKQDVALSVALEKVEQGSTLVIKAMSDRAEKVTDLLRDFSGKLDDIKSDTELIKEYTSQIEEIFDKVENVEDFLMDHLGSDFERIKSVWQDYKAGKVGRKEVIMVGIKTIGKRFIKAIVGKILD